MYVRAIDISGSRIGSSRRPAERTVDASSKSGGTNSGRTGGEAPKAAGRSIVPVGPSPSAGPRRKPELSPAFVTQLAASSVAALATGERRGSRDPSSILDKASGTYRRSLRLVTAIEPGFLVKREF
jgi:hypothetical protein